MNQADKDKIQKASEGSRQEAMRESKGNEETASQEQTIHTISPFTGTETEITPDDLEGIQKFREAQTERD